MNRPQPAIDACLAVLGVVLMLACTIGVVVGIGALIVIGWQAVLVAAWQVMSG